MAEFNTKLLSVDGITLGIIMAITSKTPPMAILLVA